LKNQYLTWAYGVSVFLLSTLLVSAYRHYAQFCGVLALPNHRSAHQGVIPRGAGIVFFILWAAGIWFGYTQHLVSENIALPLAPAVGLISAVGYCDDHISLGAARRLFAQFAISILYIKMIGGMEPWYFWGNSAVFLGWMGTILAVLGIVWSVNLFNFMDGIDGIAAVESLYVLGIGGVVCWQRGAIELAWMAVGIVASSAGFLVWNWPKAKVFMGDVGSYFLGFMMAVFAIMSNLLYQIPLAFWLILYGVFWFDATLTLIRRILNGKSWAVAHCEHAYQRLYQSGLTHQQVLWRVIGMNSLLACLAILGIQYTSYMPVCGVFAVILLSIGYLAIERMNPPSRAI